MKRLVTFLALIFSAFITVAYLYYSHWRSEHQAEEAVPYIPQSAVLVYEAANFSQQWKCFQKTPIARSMSQLPAFEAIQQTIFFFESLAKDPRNTDEIPLTVSVHGAGGEQLEYIFYFNARHKATQNLLRACMHKISSDPSYRKAERKFAGYKITTVCKQEAAKSLSYISHDQYIIVSFSPLLIEEVVRSLTHQLPGSFLTLKKNPNSQGSLYVNFNQLAQLLNIFVDHEQAEVLGTSLATFACSGQLHVNLKQLHLLLSGFVQDQGPNRQYLTHALAREASSSSTSLASYLPPNTALLRYVNCNDAAQFLSALSKTDPSHKACTFYPSNHFLAAALDPLLKGEIGHCTLAASQQSKAEQLVFMKVTEPFTIIEVLKKANLLTALSAQQPGLPASFHELKPNCCPFWFINHLFPTFEAKCLAQVDDYLILANSQAVLQTWHTQFQHGKTGAHTAAKSTWLASTLDQAQLGLLVDLQKAWPQIIQSLKPAWKQAFETHANALKSFSHASLQLFYQPNTSPYMSILLKHKESGRSQPDSAQQKAAIHEAKPLKISASPSFFQTEAPIIHSPWLVRSHRSKGGYYVLLQDSLHQLYFLDPAGKLLWKKMLEGPVITEVFEVDFYKNNKIQYGLGTNSQLHLIDYHGLKVDKYPHPLPPLLTHLQVVDYDHSKDYRLLIATAQGQVYLKDKQYRPLPAWNPKSLGCGFADTPFHVRVQGKDYFLALQKNGMLQALSRRGQVYPGFPVDLSASLHNPHNPLLICKGKTAPDTKLVVLTDTGKHICLTLTGQMQKIVQLACTEGTHYFLIGSSKTSSNRYAIVKKEVDKVKVIDEALNLLFELPLQAQKLLMQYYDFGNKLQFYAFTDPDQQCTYLYDYAGKQLLSTPLESGGEVSLVLSASKHQLEVYHCVAKQCIKTMVPLEKLTQ